MGRFAVWHGLYEPDRTAKESEKKSVDRRMVLLAE
jgi:hypothetical protein